MNIIAIVVAAVVAFIIGFLFHGPLFGKLWMRLADVHPTMLMGTGTIDCSLACHEISPNHRPWNKKNLRFI